jgi:hypothetical protein
MYGPLMRRVGWIIRARRVGIGSHQFTVRGSYVGQEHVTGAIESYSS